MSEQEDLEAKERGLLSCQIQGSVLVLRNLSAAQRDKIVLLAGNFRAEKVLIEINAYGLPEGYCVMSLWDNTLESGDRHLFTAGISQEGDASS